MTGDITGCFSQGVANPSPLPSGNLLGDGVVVCLLPQVFVADPLLHKRYTAINWCDVIGLI